MLDAILLRYLTKKGVIIYFTGQIIADVIFAYYLFGILGESLDSARDTFMIGIVIIALIFAGICLLFWKKPKEIKSESTEINK